MNLLKKITAYIADAYLTEHFPSFWAAAFGKKPLLAYYGFLGDRNFGDELVFHSAQSLFKQATLMPIRRRMPIHFLLLIRLFPAQIKGIVIGGGTLIGPIWERAFFQGLVNKGRPVFVHGTGVRTMIDERNAWQKMLSGSVFGGVRGPRSAERIREILPMGVIGDAAFVMYQGEVRAPLENEIRVLINLGVHEDYEGKDIARSAIRDLVNLLLTDGYAVEFLPCHAIDLDLGKELQSKFPALTVHKIPATFDEALSIFQHVNFALGERLHFTVMAILAGCPFQSINYADKHRDLLSSLSLSHAGGNPGDLTFETLRGVFDNAPDFDWGESRKTLSSLKDLQTKEARRFLEAILKN
jgi:hypothetical protein